MNQRIMTIHIVFNEPNNGSTKKQPCLY